MPGIDNSSYENNNVRILGIDPTAYPKIKVNIFIDELCAATGNLVKDDFEVAEDGNEVAIDNFYFMGRASGQKLDLAVVFDETDTMADEINAMKSNIDDLTNKIRASNIDALYSLVTFKTEVSTKIEWTGDAEVFKREVDLLRASGGNYQRPEDPLGGVATALSFGFRPDAQKIILVITDEPSMQRGDGWSNSPYHEDDVLQDLLDAGVMLVAVSPDFRVGTIPSNIPRSDLPLYADMRELAQNSGGLWIDIYSADFSVILDQLEEIITGTYVIEYTTPATTAGSKTVSVFVNAPDCAQGDASSSYTAPASTTVLNEPPVIIDLASDKTSPQELGSVITWTVEAEDPGGDQVLYRFFLNDEPITGWTTEKTWTWGAQEEGIYRIEAQVRDGKHAGPNGMDDRRSANFEIIEMKLPPTGEISYVEFNRTFGGAGDDGAYLVSPTSDGGYIISGHTTPNDSEFQDAWIIKTDAEGKEIWNKTFGGTGDEEAYSVRLTSDGGYILLVGTSSFSQEDEDIWLIKTDAEGQVDWSKIFGGVNNDVGQSVQQTSDGGYILAGWTASSSAEIFDAWLIKTDSEGREVWNRTFGGSNADAAHSVMPTVDGGYILAGRTFSYGKGNDWNSDAWLIKTNSQGDQLWHKTFGGTASDFAYSVHPLMEGGYILSGSTLSYGEGGSDAWLIKTDSEGNEIWNRTFGGTGEEMGFTALYSSDGGYIITASIMESLDAVSIDQVSQNQRPKESLHHGGEDVWLIKTDLEGRALWSRIFGGASQDRLPSLESTNDDGYILAGFTSSFGAGDLEAWLIKVDSEGNIVRLPSPAG